MSDEANKNSDAPPAENHPVQPRPGAGAILVRAVLSMIAGLAAMMICVVAYQFLFLMLPIMMRDPDSFEKMMEGMNDPQRMKQLIESGEIPMHSDAMLAFTLLMDAFCSFAGGAVVAWIAACCKFGHGIAIGVLMTLFSVSNAALSELEALLPAWVPWSRALISVPVGILLGAWVVSRRAKRRAAAAQ